MLLCSGLRLHALLFMFGPGYGFIAAIDHQMRCDLRLIKHGIDFWDVLQPGIERYLMAMSRYSVSEDQGCMN